MAAQCEEVAHLTAGQETLGGQLTEVVEERWVALTQDEQQGVRITRLQTELGDAQARQREEVALASKAEAKADQLKAQQAEVVTVLVQQQADLSTQAQQLDESRSRGGSVANPNQPRQPGGGIGFTHKPVGGDPGQDPVATDKSRRVDGHQGAADNQRLRTTYYAPPTPSHPSRSSNHLGPCP